jgi:hypothetical protein
VKRQTHMKSNRHEHEATGVCFAQGTRTLDGHRGGQQGARAALLSRHDDFGDHGPAIGDRATGAAAAMVSIGLFLRIGRF